MDILRIAITGSSGLVGTALSARLRGLGHHVTRVVRARNAAAAPDALFWDPAAGEIDVEGLAGHHVIVNLAGENIFGLWTRAKKRRIHMSRVAGTRLLADSLAGLPERHRPSVMINASGADYYGDRPSDQPVTEEAPPGDGFLASVVQDWEGAMAPAREAGVRTVALRFGLVLDPEGLLLKATALSTRLGVGATLGSGRQPFPWVSRDEITHVVPFVIDHHDIDGPVNVVGPDHVTHRQFADTVARLLNRPRILRVPAFALKMLGDFGRTLLGGARLVPRKLETTGYEWRDPELEGALRRMLLK